MSRDLFGVNSRFHGTPSRAHGRGAAHAPGVTTAIVPSVANWGRKRPAALPPSPASRPTERVLASFRARIEQGCPVELACRSCGITPEVHRAWMDRGAELHAAQPDYMERSGGGGVFAGSTEPEAEYVRIVLAGSATTAADLIGEVYVIAKDRKRGGQAQLAAITLLLRGLGERAFDPRTETAVEVSQAGASPAVDQRVIDAMTPEEVAALRQASRAAAETRAAAEKALAAAQARAESQPPPDAASTD